MGLRGARLPRLPRGFSGRASGWRVFLVGCACLGTVSAPRGREPVPLSAASPVPFRGTQCSASVCRLTVRLTPFAPSRAILQEVLDADLSNEAFPFSTHKLVTAAGHLVSASRP